MNAKSDTLLSWRRVSEFSPLGADQNSRVHGKKLQSCFTNDFCIASLQTVILLRRQENLPTLLWNNCQSQKKRSRAFLITVFIETVEFSF